VQRFNAYLKGWLGALDQKNTGEPPTSSEESIRGMLDALPFVYAGRVESTEAVTAGSAVEGFFGAVNVPQGEMWLVQHAAFSLANGTGANGTLAAAEEFGASLTLGSQNLFGYWALQEPQNIFLAGSFPIGQARRPFVAMPGDVIGLFYWRVVTVGNFVSTVRIRFLRCQV